MNNAHLLLLCFFGLLFLRFFLSDLVLRLPRDQQDRNKYERQPDADQGAEHEGHSTSDVRLEKLVAVMSDDGWVLFVRVDQFRGEDYEEERAEGVGAHQQTSDKAFLLGEVFPGTNQRNHVADATPDSIDEAVEGKEWQECFLVGAEKHA